MIYTMFEKPKKKVTSKDEKRLLIDFDKEKLSEPKKNDILIAEPKLKDGVNKPTIKIKPPKKGKKLF